MKKILVITCFALFLQSIVYAQGSDSAGTQKETADSTKLSFWKKHNVKFAAVPMVNYDPSLGLNMAALTNAFFRITPSDTISPLSMAGAMIGYTTNGTWYWAIYTKLYFNRDNYRATIGYGDASVNFQYYEELVSAFVDFNSLHDLFLIELQRRVYKRWYLGAKYVNKKTQTTYDIEDQAIDPQTVNMTHLGFVVSHDSRDFIYNPHTGDYINFKTGHYRDAWGATYKFDKYEFDFTKFFPINDGKTIAARVTALVATGDVPFEGQYVVGREDIRGYSNGKHRADQVYDVQAEYRWNFYKKWGMVAFGGVAVAVDSPGEITWEGLLPAVGTGLRFMAIPSEKINIGVDVAVGKDDWGLYFRIAEVFGDK